VSDTLSYHDALKILGAAKSRLVTLLDGAATAGLAVWAAAAWATGRDAGAPISLFELKNEIVLCGHEVVRKVTEWHSGLSRFDRSQRLAAAHAVLVVSSYFEALGDADLPVPIERLALTGAEQAALTAGSGVPDGYVNMLALLLQEPLPLPEAHRSYDDVRRALSDCYDRLSNRVLEFVSGLAVWDELDDGRRDRLTEMIGYVPGRALGLYDAAYRNLAADNREFAVWAGLTELHALGAGLAGVAALLSEMTVRRPGERPLAHLLASYRAVLDEPIFSTVQAPDGVVLPSLSEAYLNPHCRIAEVGPGDTPAAGEWWDKQAAVPDIETFLAGYLTSPRAARSPLVVLGEPGSGKSKLTEVLAAQLPEHDFLPLRVELRDVAAESMIQEQIEQAIYRGPGERVSWHDLLEASGGALPVVLLDGFDELVQAAAVNRYDYLEQVRDFQHRQAQIGHPVAVIVTSRTVVADQARFPAGSLALQLQPFTEPQVRHWLEIWARRNKPLLADRGLHPLPAETALAHRELAGQPLLLTMLAIFDATDNGLQRTAAHISRAELYEGLFTDFALREVGKSPQTRSLPADRQRELAGRELQRLAVVALSMFARGRQAATEVELNLDLPVLFPENADHRADRTAALSPAQRATGRFFFIHKSEARPHEDRVRSYEFLHSTFGEFLVARLTVGALRELTAVRAVLRRGLTAGGPLDDGFLYAVLSFSCLAGRAPVIDFLRELLAREHPDDRAQYIEMLPELLAGSLYPHPNRSFQDYEPIRHPIPRRLAAYSVNLVLMLVLVAGTVDGSDLFASVAVADRWREYGYLWRGMFGTNDWMGILDTIRVKVHRTDGLVDVRLTIGDGSPVSPLDSIIVTSRLQGLTQFDVMVTSDESLLFDVKVPPASIAGRVCRDAAFFPSWHASMLLLQAVPFIRTVGGKVRWQEGDEIYRLPGYSLAQLDFTRDSSPEERAQLYNALIDVMAASPELQEQLLLRLREDARRFAVDTVVDLLRRAGKTASTEPYIAIVNDLWQRLDSPAEKRSLIELVSSLRSSWPDTLDIILDRQLISELEAESGN
jgi:hypothetical protein